MSLVYLSESMFSPREKLLAEHCGISVYAFRYGSGVCALRVLTEAGEFVLLPFNGQQIWRARVLGHDLTMKTLFDEPTGSRDFLKTYGGFMLHCGLTGIGSPGPVDSHLQHGELPNACYQRASLRLGEDGDGKYVALNGAYRHLVGFTAGYSFEPECRMYARRSLVRLMTRIVNLRAKPLGYMYLCHINFRPEDGSKLISSAMRDRGSYTVHAANDPGELAAFAKRIEEAFSVHEDVGADGECYDPEICIGLRYLPDSQGLGHTMQRLPDGYAHYVSHQVRALPMPVRWIARTGDEDAMGMILPATAEHLGRANAQAKGQIMVLEPGGETRFEMEIGLLPPEDANTMKEHIKRILEAV